MIIIAATLDGLRTLNDKSIKLTFDTQELNPQELLGLMENLQHFGYLAFKKEPFNQSEREIMDGLKTDYDEGSKKKSPGQRLRNVLYICYTKDNKGFDTFTRYYEHNMEKICNHFKDKIKDL